VLGGAAGKLYQAEFARVSATNPNTFTDYDYLMKGLYEYYKYTRESNAAAREFFELAIKIDPTYARAYGDLAWTHELDYDYEWTDDDEKSLRLALENASIAVRLDPNDYASYWGLGWAHLYDRQHERALADYLRAREMNPNDAELQADMGNLLIYIGQPKQAIDQVKEAIRLNPNHEDWYVYYVGWAYEEAGMPEEAIEVFEQAFDLQNPDEEQLWYLPTVAAAYAAVGRTDDAAKVVKTILAREPDFSISRKLARYPYKTKELADRYANALRRAGLPE
jgi:tetratricopeptide (TPR) repeat protein